MSLFLAAAWRLALANWQAVAIAAVLAVVTAWHFAQIRKAKRAGYETAIHDIRDAAERLEGKADAGSLTVSQCFGKGEPWVWDRGSGTCKKSQ